MQKIIKNITILTITILAILLINTKIYSENKKVPYVYVVQEGDTLWSISEKFFQDPLYWPTLWELNSYVEDPHWINPGEMIILKKKPIVEHKPAPIVEIKNVEPIEVPVEKKEEITDSFTMDSCGYILSKDIYEDRKITEEWGKIIGAKKDKENFVKYDKIYLNQGNIHGIAKGQLYTIFRSVKEVTHCYTKKDEGYLIQILGIASIDEVTQSSSVAIITKSFFEICVGDQFMDYEQIDTPYKLMPENKNIEGCIIESRFSKENLSSFDIVYLDIGDQDNIKPGNFFYTYECDTLIENTGSSDQKDVICTSTGELSILRIEKNTSTALITRSYKPLKIGSRVKFF